LLTDAGQVIAGLQTQGAFNTHLIRKQIGGATRHFLGLIGSHCSYPTNWRRFFMATYKQLTAQLEKLHKEVAVAREKEIEQAIADIKQKIVEYGITAEELGFAGKRAAAKKTPSPAKYRNPKTGETWSGRGRSPGWLAGKNRERFLITD
jgi:DNA-binding protein H-NS